MLPERDGDFAGKKALDGPGVKHFASRGGAPVFRASGCVLSSIGGAPGNFNEIGLKPNNRLGL